MMRTGEERLIIASQMFDSARTLVMASLPPGLDEVELRARLCERFYGSEVNAAAFVCALRKSAQDFAQSRFNRSAS